MNENDYDFQGAKTIVIAFLAISIGSLLALLAIPIDKNATSLTFALHAFALAAPALSAYVLVLESNPSRQTSASKRALLVLGVFGLVPSGFAVGAMFFFASRTVGFTFMGACFLCVLTYFYGKYWK